MQNMEKLRSWAMRVVAGPTVRQAKQAQHWDDRKSQSRCVTRRICPRRSGRTWQERMWNRLNREEQMTSDACRLVRPGAAAQWSAAKTATNQYCQVVREEYDASSRCIALHRAAGRLGRVRP